MAGENRPSIAEQLGELFNPQPHSEVDPENELLEPHPQARPSQGLGRDYDLGRRRIMPDIPLDPKFGARPTTLQKLAQVAEDSAEENSSEDEEDLGGDDDDDEGGEEEESPRLPAKSKSLKRARTEAPSKSTNQPIDNENEDEAESAEEGRERTSQENEPNEEESEDARTKGRGLRMGKQKKESEEGVEGGQGATNEEVEAALDELRAEDQEMQQKDTLAATEIEKGRQVVQQKKVTDCFIGVRILLQKMLGVANKLPQEEAVMAFQEADSQIQDKYAETVAKTRAVIARTLSIQSLLTQQCGIQAGLHTDIQDAKVESVWNAIKANQDAVKDHAFGIVENWMTKTQLYVNTRLKQSLTTLAAHPLRQVEDKYRKSREKLLRKAQLKSRAFRVLGKPRTTINEVHDPETYEDFDSYQTLLKDYLSLNARTAAILGSNPDTDGLDMTYKFLQGRGFKDKKLRQGAASNQKKRKNKALKYTVHDKLVNFTTQLPNPDIMPGHENIVKSLFGLQLTQPTSRPRLGTEELAAALEKEERPNEEPDVVLI